MDIRTTFPTAFVRTSDTTPQEQVIPLGEETTITLVTFSRRGSTHTGVLVEGIYRTGCFQRRGYVGNSLEDGRINPVTTVGGKAYDLTLDNTIVASFLYHPHQGRWESL